METNSLLPLWEMSRSFSFTSWLGRSSHDWTGLFGDHIATYIFVETQSILAWPPPTNFEAWSKVECSSQVRFAHKGLIWNTSQLVLITYCHIKNSACVYATWHDKLSFMLFLEPEVRCSHWCCLEYVDGCFHVNMDANSYTQGCLRPRCGSRTTCPFHYVSCDAAAACHCMPASDLILGSQNWVSHRAEGRIWRGNCLQRKENEVRCVRWVWVEDLKFDFDLVLMFFMVH